jgi:hypothetical protein
MKCSAENGENRMLFHVEELHDYIETYLVDA